MRLRRALRAPFRSGLLWWYIRPTALDTMSGSTPTERCELALSTPAGRITTAVEVPTAFVPVTAIVPLGRQLAAQAQQLEVEAVEREGCQVSCRQGCAACCRMLVPVSAPEVFHLRDALNRLPESDRARLLQRVGQTQAALEAAGLLDRLRAVADTDRAIADEELEPLNHAYYALRLPCPFLDHEQCAIYEHRPAACRELLVTSPAEWCDDLAQNPVQAVPVSVRLSTALGLLWAGLRQEAPRLIPLPVALDWADRHQAEQATGGKGPDILDQFLDKLWRLLSQEFTARQSTQAPAPPPQP